MAGGVAELNAERRPTSVYGLRDGALGLFMEVKMLLLRALVPPMLVLLGLAVTGYSR